MYLSKKVCPIYSARRGGIQQLTLQDIKGETRLAVTTHESADVGVCIRNYLDGASSSKGMMRTVELDIDIGAEAVDYK